MWVNVTGIIHGPMNEYLSVRICRKSIPVWINIV